MCDGRRMLSDDCRNLLLLPPTRNCLESGPAFFVSQGKLGFEQQQGKGTAILWMTLWHPGIHPTIPLTIRPGIPAGGGG